MDSIKAGLLQLIIETLNLISTGLIDIAKLLIPH